MPWKYVYQAFTSKTYIYLIFAVYFRLYLNTYIPYHHYYLFFLPIYTKTFLQNFFSMLNRKNKTFLKNLHLNNM